MQNALYDLARDNEAQYRVFLRVRWELIEPLDDRSIYADFLASHGRGASRSPPRARR